MSARPNKTAPRQRGRSRSSGGAMAVWLIAILVAFVATVQLRMLEGLVPVHGPGIVLTLDASGLTSLDLQDAINNLAAGGGEALALNGHRIILGVDIEQSDIGVSIDGTAVSAPWSFEVIGDPNRLAETADLMTQQLRGDRRVHVAAYSVAQDLVVRAVVTERPFVYAVSS